MVPPPGLVPPVMSYCTFPDGGFEGKFTLVFNPEGVIGGTCAAVGKTFMADKERIMHTMAMT